MSYDNNMNLAQNVKDEETVTDEKRERWLTKYLQLHCHEGMSFQAKISFLADLWEFTGLTPCEGSTLRIFMSFGDGDGKNIQPLRAQIAALQGRSSSTVKNILVSLTKKGWLRSHQPNHLAPPIRAFRIPPKIEARIQAALDVPGRKKRETNPKNKPHWTVEKIWAANM
jgi:hypothetical protein